VLSPVLGFNAQGCLQGDNKRRPSCFQFIVQRPNEAGYRDWLKASFQSATVTTQLSEARRLEAAYGDLDEQFERDKFGRILDSLTYSAADKAAGKANPSRVLIDGENLYEGLAHLRSALGYYRRFRDAQGTAKGPATDWPELETMRATFLKRCADFIDFGQDSGTYFDSERAYKDPLISEAQTILSAGNNGQTEQTGLKFLDLLDPKKSNFVGWRAYAEIAAGGESARQTAALALGELVLSPDNASVAVAAAAELIHPIISKGAMGNPAFGQVRSLVSTALALAKPSEAISIKTRFMQRAAKALTGKTIFKSAVVSADEYQAFLDLAVRIRDVMIGWNWKPRDLWDVQGFLWVVTDDDWAAQGIGPSTTADDDKDDEIMTNAQGHPLNRILLGPPGTGKTWATARLAVEICNGSAPSDRDKLMEAYNDLVKASRVTFTTFHQSIGYEEFVEGLRPVTDSDVDGDETGQPTAGFRLEPRNGIFRDICALAEQARKRGGKAGKFDFSGRQFFKMSLGRARTESHIYEAAIEGNYIVLGWGGDIDWSDSKYNDYQTIVDRWRQEEPGAKGNSGNISQVWRFRSSMNKGDIVVVSEGNLRFRAIGEVTGDYQFHPQNEGGNHRRLVKWLAVLDESLPIEIIHEGNLSQVSCYLLTRSQMKLEALSELITTDPAPSSSMPESFVLIIDEINRANVSKVLGELITLLEPDKRLGERNALTVKLPYSNDVFGVPNNLYVIGTMNTADRSIALLDTALRRRFHFTEMMPDYSCLDKVVSGIHLGNLLSAVNRRVEWLFDRDHQIGHSFFTGVEDKAVLDQVMQTKVIPQLTEYFYDDWEKVCAALNDSGGWFIRVVKLAAPPMLQEEGEERSRYSINQGEIAIDGYLAASELV